MNLASLIGLAFAFLCASATSIDDKWDDFKAKFDIKYDSLDEEAKRFEIFSENCDDFDKHNEQFEIGNLSYKLGVNRYADHTHEEINEKFGGKPMSWWEEFKSFWTFKISPYSECNLNESIEAPDSLDWREQGAVTPVKDQKECGSCWTFGILGALESHYFIKTGQLLNLSEQQLVDCVTDNFGCNGGFTWETYTYLIHNDIVLAEDYPYEEKQVECRADEFNKTDVKVFGYARVESSEESLRAAVNEFGPVQIFIDAMPISFRFYSEGIYSYSNCYDFNFNHVVLVIGYGTDYDTNQDYWLIKNSWSESWGEEGYLRLARNNNSSCGIVSEAFFPQLNERDWKGVEYFPYVFYYFRRHSNIIIGTLILVILSLICFCCCACHKCRKYQVNSV